MQHVQQNIIKYSKNKNKYSIQCKIQTEPVGRHNMPPPRSASGDTIYIIHASGSVTNSMSMLACQYSQPKRSGDLDLLILKVVSESRVTSATSEPILVFLGLSVLDLDPMYVTHVRQHHRLMPCLGGGA